MGQDMLKTLIELLEAQEEIKITYKMEVVNSERKVVLTSDKSA